jgi:hypothetical protein
LLRSCFHRRRRHDGRVLIGQAQISRASLRDMISKHGEVAGRYLMRSKAGRRHSHTLDSARCHLRARAWIHNLGILPPLLLETLLGGLPVRSSRNHYHGRSILVPYIPLYADREHGLIFLRNLPSICVSVGAGTSAATRSQPLPPPYNKRDGGNSSVTATLVLRALPKTQDQMSTHTT